MIRAFAIDETISAPPAAVWRVAGDPTRFPEWMAGLRRVGLPEDGTLAAGAALPAHVDGGRAGRETVLTLADWTPESGFALAAGRPGARTVYHYRFAPAEDGAATHVTLTAEAELSGKWRLLAWLVARGMKRADGGQLRALARLVVAEAPG